MSATIEHATRITEQVVFHGEGPFWDDRAQRLLWVDMLAGAIMSRDASGGIRRHPVPSPVAAIIRHRASGGFVVVLEHGVWTADDALETFAPVVELTDDAGIKLNEGGCDPQGRLLAGSMAYDEHEGGGALYRIRADHRAETVLPAVSISNGLQFSADGRRAYYVDTPTGRIDVIELDEQGEWGERRPFVVVDGPGSPDGMAIDEEDGLWVALWGGDAVRHYDRDGVLRETIRVPASHVTACTFGGPDRRTLYITTSQLAIPEGSEPEAGALFAWEAPVRGAVPHAWAG